MTKKEAEEICGGLSRPSKMPGHGYSLPAAACRTGSKLVRIDGAVCRSCYARKGHYAFKNVRPALERRLASLDDPRWLDAMATLLWRDLAKGMTWFRFHDSGDLQSPAHLTMLLTLARSVPDMRFWIPTLEVRDVAAVVFHDALPSNVNIRLSTPMVDGFPTDLAMDLSRQVAGVTLSKVAGRDVKTAPWYECPAVKYKLGTCGECRACWDRTTEGVVYFKH